MFPNSSIDSKFTLNVLVAEFHILENETKAYTEEIFLIYKVY